MLVQIMLQQHPESCEIGKCCLPKAECTNNDKGGYECLIEVLKALKRKKELLNSELLLEMKNKIVLLISYITIKTAIVA